MLKKKWVKTGLAALLFSCLLVAAFAEPVMVRVSDIQAELADGSTVSASHMDRLCYLGALKSHSMKPESVQNSIKFIDAKFAWFLGGINSSSGDTRREFACFTKGQVIRWEGDHLVWYPANPEFGHDTVAYGTAFCPEGSGLYDEKPDGCYEQKDVTQECQTARENLLQHGTPLPEYCAEFPPNPPLCEGMNDPNEQNEKGGVACTIDNSQPPQVCFWESPDFKEDYTHPIARQVLYSCITYHEQIHIETQDKYRLGCVPMNRDMPNRGRLGRGLVPISEMFANQESIQCLENGKAYCQGNQDCIDQLDAKIGVERGQIDKNRDTWLNYCSSHPNFVPCQAGKWPEVGL